MSGDNWIQVFLINKFRAVCKCLQSIIDVHRVASDDNSRYFSVQIF